MNAAQRTYIRKLKLKLLLVGLFFTILFILPDGLFSSGQLMLFSALVVAAIKLFSKSSPTPKKDRELTLLEEIEKYPVLAAWYLICGITGLLFLGYVLISGFNILENLSLGKTALIVFFLILPVALPRIIINEYEKYRSLGSS